MDEYMVTAEDNETPVTPTLSEAEITEFLTNPNGVGVIWKDKKIQLIYDVKSDIAKALLSLIQ